MVRAADEKGNLLLLAHRIVRDLSEEDTAWSATALEQKQSELNALLQLEARTKKESKLALPARHSRFGGTFTKLANVSELQNPSVHNLFS